MGFKNLPKDKAGYDKIFVVVDRLGKSAFYLPAHRKQVLAAHQIFTIRTYGEFTVLRKQSHQIGDHSLSPSISMNCTASVASREAFNNLPLTNQW